MRKFFDACKTRLGRFFYPAFEVSVALVLTIIPSAIISLFKIQFFKAAQAVFYWFTITPIIAAALRIVFPAVKEDEAWPYACGLYYGGAVIGGLMRKMGLSCPLGVYFVISSLVCLVVFFYRKSEHR